MNTGKTLEWGQTFQILVLIELKRRKTWGKRRTLHWGGICIFLFKQTGKQHLRGKPFGKGFSLEAIHHPPPQALSSTSAQAQLLMRWGWKHSTSRDAMWQLTWERRVWCVFQMHVSKIWGSFRQDSQRHPFSPSFQASKSRVLMSQRQRGTKGNVSSQQASQVTFHSSGGAFLLGKPCHLSQIAPSSPAMPPLTGGKVPASMTQFSHLHGRGSAKSPVMPLQCLETQTLQQTWKHFEGHVLFIMVRRTSRNMKTKNRGDLKHELSFSNSQEPTSHRINLLHIILTGYTEQTLHSLYMKYGQTQELDGGIRGWRTVGSREESSWGRGLIYGVNTLVAYYSPSLRAAQFSYTEHQARATIFTGERGNFGRKRQKRITQILPACHMSGWLLNCAYMEKTQNTSPKSKSLNQTEWEVKEKRVWNSYPTKFPNLKKTWFLTIK